MSTDNDDDSQGGIPLIEDLSDSDPQSQSRSNKRKRTAEDDELKRAAKRKKRKAKKPADIDDSALDSELCINHAIAHMDPALTADHLAQRIRRSHPEMSIVEQEDLRLPASAIVDTTTFAKTRTAENLPTFLERFSIPPGASNTTRKKLKLSLAPTTPGTPHTLLIAASGLRAADLTRALRRYQTKDALVAKLFAKHIKLAAAVEMVQKTRMNFGIGTPQRLKDLIEEGSLKLEGLERVVVDASHIDAKKRGILDVKELVGEVAGVLGRCVREGKEGVQLLFF